MEDNIIKEEENIMVQETIIMEDKEEINIMITREEEID
jgi:hypothetical protein